MINSLFIAKTGMQSQQTQLDVIAHNLANVSTTGYKRAHAVFEDLMYQNLRQVGAQNGEGSELPTGLHLGLGVRTVATTRDFSAGIPQESNSELDVAINGHGFFEVTLPDGSTAYTRDGSFQLDAQGQLVTEGGLPLAAGITIPAGASKITIAPDGQVSAKLSGQSDVEPLGQITLARFINPAGLEPRGDNLFLETAASGAPQQGSPGSDGLGTLKQGYLEGSNVNVVQELVTMIQTQRAYELNSKAVQTSDQMLARLTQI